MIKQFTVNCNFRTTKAPVTFYVGDPSDETNPIYFQTKWLTEKKGGTIPKEILESFVELQKVAAKNRVSFQELCGFVIDELNSDQATLAERDRIHKNLAIVQKVEKQKQLSSAAQAAPANAGAATAAPSEDASTNTKKDEE